MSLAGRARSWSDMSLRAKALAVTAPALAAILLSTGSLMIVTSREQAAERGLTTALDEQRALTQFLSDDLNMEATVWNYAESVSPTTYTSPPEESLLASAHQESRQVARDLSAIGSYVRNDQVARRHLARITSLVARDDELDRQMEQMATLPNLQSDTFLGLVAQEGLTVISIRTGVTTIMQGQAASRTAAARRSVANVRTALYLTVLASVIVGIGGGLASVMLFTSGVGRRIRLLHRAARDMEEGRPPDHLPTGTDEIGSLGRALRHASEMLAEREAGLQEAREAAVVASNAKSDFLARMSHELRTPLNAIIGFGQILEVEDPTDDQRDSVGHILRAGTHLLNLINEVLDIARVESGHLDLSIEPVSTGELVHEVIDLLRPLAAERNIELRAGKSDAKLTVAADHQRLRQVLINLVSNAIKYNRPGGTATVEASPAAIVGTVRISVTDTGIGIPPARRGDVFAPFERLDAEGSEIEGSGVGLSLCRRLIEEMDGSIGFDSMVGEGSTFWVELAAAQPGTAAKGALRWAPEGVPEGTVVTDYLGRARILYVEDDRSNLALMEKIMRHHPHLEMVSATRGKQALELAVESPPDLVLIDTHLADMTGEELVAALRCDPTTAATPIIVVSGDAMDSSITRLRSAGATAYLTKPFSLREFNDALHAGLRGES